MRVRQGRERVCALEEGETWRDPVRDSARKRGVPDRARNRHRLPQAQTTRPP